MKVVRVVKHSTEMCHTAYLLIFPTQFYGINIRDICLIYLCGTMRDLFNEYVTSFLEWGTPVPQKYQSSTSPMLLISVLCTNVIIPIGTWCLSR